MAVEVKKGYYMRTTQGAQVPPKRSNRPRISPFRIQFKAQTAQKLSPVESTQTPIAFYYNPLHDLESLWWVGTYFIVNKDVVCWPRREGFALNPAFAESEEAHCTRLDNQVRWAQPLFYQLWIFPEVFRPSKTVNSV